MNYKDFNDYELIDKIYSFDEDANEIMIYKYRPLIVNIAEKMIKYCNGGVTLDDLVQEGMVALNEAVNTFDEEKEANFGTYAKICITRRITSIVKSTRTYKNKYINEAVSLDNDDEDTVVDMFLIDNTANPLDMVSDYEWQQRVLDKLTEELTDMERQVFELKKNDFNYREIAEILEKKPKTIDNTLQRIKAKLKNIMSQD